MAFTCDLRTDSSGHFVSIASVPVDQRGWINNPITIRPSRFRRLREHRTPTRARLSKPIVRPGCNESASDRKRLLSGDFSSLQRPTDASWFTERTRPGERMYVQHRAIMTLSRKATRAIPNYCTCNAYISINTHVLQCMFVFGWIYICIY